MIASGVRVICDLCGDTVPDLNEACPNWGWAVRRRVLRSKQHVCAVYDTLDLCVDCFTAALHEGRVQLS